MLSASLQKTIIADIRSHFPNIRAVILWGGALTRRNALRYGDIDLVLVLTPAAFKSPERMRQRLAVIKQGFSAQGELEPLALSTADLPRKQLVFETEKGSYRAHSMMGYQLRHESRVIFGDLKIRDRLYNWDFDSALRSFLPLAIAGATNALSELSVAKSMSEYLTKRKTTFYILARQIFKIEHRRIGSKEEALRECARLYPQTRSLMSYLIKTYRRQSRGKVSGKAEVRSFLQLAQARMERYLAS